MTLRNIAIWVFIGVVVVGAYAVVSNQTTTSSTHQIIYSELQQKIEQHQILSLKLKGDEAVAKDKSTTPTPPSSRLTARRRWPTRPARPASPRSPSTRSRPM